MASMATKEQSSVNNITNNMSGLTFKPIEMGVIRVHGGQGDQLTPEQRDFIVKYLDVVQLVKPGDKCTSTGDESHPQHVMNSLVFEWGNDLWANTQKGIKARKEATALLRQWKFGNEVLLWEPNYNWNFTNKSKSGEMMTIQLTGDDKAIDLTTLFPEKFTLYDLAYKVATGGLYKGVLGLGNDMPVDIPEDTPFRAKVIIIACQGFKSSASSGASGGTKSFGGRRKKTRKKRKTRRKKRRKKTRKKRKRKKRKRRK